MSMGGSLRLSSLKRGLALEVLVRMNLVCFEMLFNSVYISRDASQPAGWIASTRITPFESLYIFDFVDNHGAHMEARTGLVVVDGQIDDGESYEMEPLGWDATPSCELEMYFLHPARSYEIRRGKTNQLLKTITFSTQVTTTVDCD
jgi:hypothetical protein